ncbi:hypothetical protein D9M68_907830 [compost metagenome]
MALGQSRAMERARPRHEAVPQVGCHAGHAARQVGLAAQLLEQFEHQALDRIGGTEAAVQRGVGMRLPQRGAVGGAAQAGRRVSVRISTQVRRMLRHRPHRAP